jgi:hypothetical protein
MSYSLNGSTAPDYCTPDRVLVSTLPWHILSFLLLIWSEHLPFMIAVGALHAHQLKHNYAQYNCGL